MASARTTRKTTERAPSGREGAAEMRPQRLRRGREAASTLHERFIVGVPARIMRPRLVFICCLVAIVCFGLLMVYSASAVEAQQEVGSATHYLVRQAIFVAIGGVGALCIALGVPFNLARFRNGGARTLLVFCLFFLVVVLLFAEDIGGAKRWINLGFFSLQPSELSKPVIILLAAQAFTEYFGERSIDGSQLALSLGLGVAAPVALIILEPDLGSTLIISAAVVAMACFSGLPTKIILRVGAIFLVLAAAAIAVEPYRLVRLVVASDPWADPYGDGFQATLSIMAFASGGLFGRGIGNSTMKYNYLPEAHNDYILAIIGEEVGFVGTLIFFAVFLLMIYAAFKVAERSPTLYGRLIAAGCATILAFQFFVNALGILGVTPMTGKTLPFISYGGSSMISCLLLAGLIIRVSVESYDGNPYHARRERFAVVDEASGYSGRSTAGAPRRRSEAARSRGFSVYDGGGAAGAMGAPRPRGGQDAMSGRTRTVTRSRGGADGYERIDLHADATERLRGRGSRGSSVRDGNRPGAGRRGRRGGRDGYDR